MQIRQHMHEKKQSRKARIKELAISNPELASILKIKRNRKTKLLKRNKILRLAPYKKVKREGLKIN